jgi:hypothetical protein
LSHASSCPPADARPARPADRTSEAKITSTR